MEAPVNPVNRRSAGLTIFAENHVLLAKRLHTIEGRRNPLGGYWSIFTGGICDGEDAETAAKREMYEEVSIKVLTKIFYVDTLKCDPKDTSSLLFVYCATYRNKPTVKLNHMNDEFSEYIWYPVEKLEEFPYNMKDDLKKCLCSYRDDKYKI